MTYWLLFIHKILFSSTCFEPQVLIFRRMCVPGGLSVHSLSENSNCVFIHKILFSSTCFEPQVLIFKRIQLYTSSIWYCHPLWKFLVACRYTAWVRNQAVYLFIKYYSPLHISSLKCSSSGEYSCIQAAYDTVTLNESFWWPVRTQLERERRLCSDRTPGNLLEIDSSIRCVHTTVSSWRWVVEAQNK